MANPVVRVEVQTTGVTPNLLDPERIGPLMVAIGEAIRQRWSAAVQGHLLPGMARPIFSPEYERGLSTPESLAYPFHGDIRTGAVVWVPTGGADADLPRRVEEGYRAFDIKPGLLRGPKHREGKKGPYSIVGFRHMTPGTTGRYAGQMPQWAYRLARRLEASVQAERGGKVQWGGRLRVPERRAIAGVQSPWHDPLVGIHGRRPEHGVYRWKSSMFEGMTRLEKTYENARQSSYMTFRAVSGRSDPGSWIHPGVAPNPVIRALTAEIPGIVDSILAAHAEAL